MRSRAWSSSTTSTRGPSRVIEEAPSGRRPCSLERTPGPLFGSCSRLDNGWSSHELESEHPIASRASPRSLVLGSSRSDGQPHDERRPLSCFARKGQGAPVFLDDDGSRDGEAEPSALADPLGGEEGLEDTLSYLGWNAVSGVGDVDEHMVAVGPRLQREGASPPFAHHGRHFRNRMSCVDDEGE